MDETNDAPEVIETPALEVETPAVETPAEEVVEVEADERDTKIAELEEKNKKLFARAKEAEAQAKKTPTPAVPQQSSMSLADATALLKADVHEEDIERVEKFAASEKISVREALKHDELKAILGVRAEKRSSANAANTSNVRRGPSQVSEDVLMSKAAKGQLPDSDDEISRLIAAKVKQSKA